MTALSIRHMNFTLHELERIQAMRSAAVYAALPVDRERSHYWHIQKKTKKGWKTICEFTGTKLEAADYFCKWFRESERGKFRLRHLVAY